MVLTFWETNKQLARKLVTMGLQRHLNTLCSQNIPLSQLIEELEYFHTCGTTLRSINVCSERIANMVKSLKNYARCDEESIQIVDIHEGLEDTLVIFENRLKKLKLIKNYQSLPQTECQPIALQQVWTNLIANAIDAISEKGELEISTRLKQDTFIEVSFKDNGCGIPLKQQSHIFELNYTTKTEGDFGLGIGLSVCQQIIHRHHGKIEVISTPNIGTQMIITLPLKQRTREKNYG